MHASVGLLVYRAVETCSFKYRNGRARRGAHSHSQPPKPTGCPHRNARECSASIKVVELEIGWNRARTATWTRQKRCTPRSHRWSPQQELNVRLVEQVLKVRLCSDVLDQEQLRTGSREVVRSGEQYFEATVRSLPRTVVLRLKGNLWAQSAENLRVCRERLR